MTPQLFDHVAFLLLVAVFPVWDFFWLRRQAALILAGRTELRLGLYRRVIGGAWAITIVLVLVWFALGRGGAELGLGFRGGALAWIGYGLTAVLCAVAVMQALWLVRRPDRLAAVRDKVQALRFLLPHTRTELRTFIGLSVTAGICEEVMFRGYVIAYLTAAFGAPFWVAAVLSSIAFGLAHAYQGPRGIVGTAAVGGVLALLFGITGSLWAPIVVHAVLDIANGGLAHAAFGRGAPDGSSADVAA